MLSRLFNGVGFTFIKHWIVPTNVKRLFFIGTSIWQELPFSAVVDDQNISKACSSCFVNDKRMFRCSKCSLVHYCSKVSSNAFDQKDG